MRAEAGRRQSDRGEALIKQRRLIEEDDRSGYCYLKRDETKTLLERDKA